MRPKSYGSSTMGMKKSVVAIRACWSLSRYTAASSEVSLPTIKAAKGCAAGMPASKSDSTPGAILQPQPPPCESEVKRGRSEEHTSELQSLMRISYAVFCLKKKNNTISVYTHT